MFATLREQFEDLARRKLLAHPDDMRVVARSLAVRAFREEWTGLDAKVIRAALTELQEHDGHIRALTPAVIDEEPAVADAGATVTITLRDEVGFAGLPRLTVRLQADPPITEGDVNQTDAQVAAVVAMKAIHAHFAEGDDDDDSEDAQDDDVKPPAATSN